MRICYCGIRFFFVHVLQRNWHLFDILRAKNEARLPAILSLAEVHGILRCVRTKHNHAFLSTVYACGLRPLRRSREVDHLGSAGVTQVRNGLRRVDQEQDREQDAVIGRYSRDLDHTWAAGREDPRSGG